MTKQYKHTTVEVDNHEVDLRLTYNQEEIIDSQNSTPSHHVYRTHYEFIRAEVLSNPTDVPDNVLDDLLTTTYTWEDY